MTRFAGICIAIFFGLLSWGPMPAAAKGNLCRETIDLKLNSTHRASESTHDCYRVVVDEPGLLAVDVSDPSRPDGEPKLIFLDSSEGILWRTPRALIVEIPRPGIYYFAVSAEDATRPLQRFKLRNAFARQEAIHAASASTTAPTCKPPQGANAPHVVSKEVDPNTCDPFDARVDATLRALCEKPRSADDDHGDTPLCATALRAREAVSGRLENSDGDDEDFFTFVLDEQRDVEIKARGTGSVLHVTLYSENGLRLGTDTNGRLVRTLPAGRYHLRLVGQLHTAENYQIRFFIQKRVPLFSVPPRLVDEEAREAQDLHSF